MGLLSCEGVMRSPRTTRPAVSIGHAVEMFALTHRTVWRVAVVAVRASALGTDKTWREVIPGPVVTETAVLKSVRGPHGPVLYPRRSAGKQGTPDGAPILWVIHRSNEKRRRYLILRITIDAAPVRVGDLNIVRSLSV